MLHNVSVKSKVLGDKNLTHVTNFLVETGLTPKLSETISFLESVFPVNLKWMAPGSPLYYFVY